MRWKTTMIAGLLAGLALLLTACNGGGAPPQDLALSGVSPSSPSVVQGGSVTLTLTFTSQNGFQGKVSLSVTENGQTPSWLTLSPTSANLNVPKGGQVQETLQVGVASNAPTGPHSLKLKATYGSKTAERDLTLTVTAPPPPPDFTLSLNPTSLSVQQGSQAQTTLTLTPQNGFTGTVTLSLVAGQDPVPQGLTLSPTSVQVTGSNPVSQALTISASSSSTPAGTYRIKVRGTSESLTQEADLTVTVSAPQPVRDFSVSVSQSTLTVQQGLRGTNWFTLTPQNPEDRLPTYLEVSLLGLPQGVTYSPTSISIPDNRVGPYDQALLVDVSRAAPPGSHPLTLRVTAGSLVREASFTLVVEGAPDYDLSLQPESLTLLQGTSGQVTLTVTPRYGFMGRIDLSLVGAPQGIALSPSYVQLSSSTPQSFTLTLSVDYSAPAGTYDLRVRGTDLSLSKEVPLTLTVEAQPQAQEVRIAKVEWGQTLLLENPRLIAQKPALLRVHLVASPGPAWLSAPLAGTAYAEGSLLGNLSFTCPSPIPTSTNQADLATTCNATLPASWVVPGLRVELRADPQDALGGDPAEKSRTLIPQVEPGPTLHLTVVPVVYQGVMPTIPDFKPTVLAIWPLKDVEYTVRAPYTYSGFLFESGYGWDQLLDELRLLRQADGSGRYYYGFVRVSYTSGIVGIGYVGYPVAVGWDQPQTASAIMAHELGHNFGRLHVSCGDGGSFLDPDYPYPDGSIGIWGYDPKGNSLDPSEAAVPLKDPAVYKDIMSYCGPEWVSDYNYYAAWDFLKANPPSPQSLPTEGLLFSGRILGDQVVFNPPVRLAADPEGNPSPYTLRVDGREYPVYVLEDSEGVVHFQAKVPVGSWSRAALYREGRLLAEISGGVKPQGQAEPQVDLREEGGFLVVRWTGYPFLSLFHVAQDGTRTALGLWHKGGESRFALEGLPPGGSFEVQLSDGVEVRVLTFPR